jgi:hypothetical protein
MKRFAWVALCLVTLGCLTLSGTYKVVAVDADGKPFPDQLNIIAEGSGIYTVRNALCRNYPGATIVITDADTGEELKRESPYKCWWSR